MKDEVQIMKKIEKMICFTLLILSFGILFSGCSLLGSKPITIYYETDYGYLSCDSIELTTNDIISQDNAPTIYNEGDSRIFSYWACSDGTMFQFGQKYSLSTINLHAVFEDAELVWYDSWKENESVFSKKYSSNHDYYYSAQYSSDVTTTSANHNFFKKIAKRECLDIYITQNEFSQDSLSKACFITESNIKTYVTSSDLTMNTYQYGAYLVINGNGYGYVDYMPKGVPVPSEVYAYISRNDIVKKVVNNIDENCTYSIGQLSSNDSIVPKYLSNSTGVTSYSALTDSAISGYSYINPNISYQSNYYFFFVRASFLKFYSYNGTQIRYHYINRNGVLCKNVTLEQYNALI